MSAIDLIQKHNDFQSLAEIRNPAAIKAVANLTASKLVLTNGSKDFVSSTIAEGDLVTASSTTTFTNKTFDANGTGNSISNLEVADFASGVIDTDLSSVSGSHDTFPSAKATKTAIDAAIASIATGVDWKDSVRMATTANIAVLGAVTVADIDGSAQGVTLVAGNRVLVAAQSTASQNGIYVVGTVTTGIAALTRSTDADADAEVTNGLSTNVSEGSKAGYLARLTTADPIVVGTTALSFSIDPVNVIGGAGLGQSGATLSVNVDDSSIEINSDTLRVKASGVTNAMLAGSIADSKLSTITTANKVSGSAVQLKSGSALADSTGLDVTVDASTIENNAGTLRVKSAGIGAAQLASDAVTTVKILDANVTFAKLSANAKPAVGTFNATTDWTSSVVTITAATHGLGTNVTATVDKVVSSAIVGTYFPEIASNGDVSFEVVSGLEFAGRYTISKRA